MRSLMYASIVAPALVLLSSGVTRVQAQTYTVPGGTEGSWSGYAPGYTWGGYAPGSGWTGYVPGTPSNIVAQPPTTLPPGYVATTPTPAPFVTQPIDTPAPSPATTAIPGQARRLINGVRNPVPGATPYADGRARNYYEYGSGRRIPLSKPWLPGAPR